MPPGHWARSIAPVWPQAFWPRGVLFCPRGTVKWPHAPVSPFPSCPAHAPGRNHMTKRCLVTGGAGFIGCALSSSLADRYDEVVALDNLHPQIHAQPGRPERLDPRVRLVVGDVTRAADVGSLLDQFEPVDVVHLAAETGTGQSLTESARHGLVNVVGTNVLLDALHGRVVPRQFVLSSSRAVYGGGFIRMAAHSCRGSVH